MEKLLPIKHDIEIDGFYTIYYFEHNKDYSKMPEKHNYWEIVYVDEGEIVAIVDGKAKTLTQGTVIFHEPNEPHAHIANKKNPHNILVVTFETQSTPMDFFRKKIFMLDEHSKAVLSLFLEEASKSIGPPPWIYDYECEVDENEMPIGGTQLTTYYFTEFLLGLIRKSTVVKEASSLREALRLGETNPLIQIIIEKMKQAVYSQLTLDDICEMFMLGKSKLTSEFKKYTGKSPMKYYKSVKIKEAKKLLRQDELSVSEISEKLGYSTIHIFSRAFKNEVGFSPLEYKKSVAEQQSIG